MKLRIFAFFCYLAAFAVGALGVTYWVELTEAVAQSKQPDIAVSVTDSAQEKPAAPTTGLRGPVYDSERPDSRLIRVNPSEPGETSSGSKIIRVAPSADAPAPVREQTTSSGGGEAATQTAISSPQPLAAPARLGVPLEKMIGQMLIFGFQGTSPDQKWPKAVAGQLAEGTIGGVMFLKYNLAGKAQARRLLKYLHSRSGKTEPRPFFMLDQEGGHVQRLSSNVGVKRWPAASRIGRGTQESAYAEYSEMASVIKDWGFNVNLGPVVDVNVNPRNPIIGKLGRSFSGDPYKVSDFARTFIDAHREQGVLTTIKHFPGHGSSRKDSHLGFTDISSTWQERSELAPYRELIGSGAVDMVMTGHLYLDSFAAEGGKKYPATLSRAVITGLLRNKLGYDGVVISDDMEMGAIRRHFGTYEAAILAIKAGVDLLIVSNSARPDINLPEKYIAAIAEAARRDPALMARIEESYLRIVSLKKRLASAPQAGLQRRTG